MAPGLVTPEKAARGKLPTDVWWHTIVSTNGAERTGYPTQKPHGILRRIVQASTEPGDLVLDFFAGSGTTGAAALELGRRVLLVDESPDAVAVMRTRLSTAAVYGALNSPSSRTEREEVRREHRLCRAFCRPPPLRGRRRTDASGDLASRKPHLALELTFSTVEPGDDQRWSTWPAITPTQRGPEPWPDWVVTSAGAIDTELGVVKTGKEADLYLIERFDPGLTPADPPRQAPLLAAKRYRTPEHRDFHRSAEYQEGRRTRRSRDERAVEKGTAYGRAFAAGHVGVRRVRGALHHVRARRARAVPGAGRRHRAADGVHRRRHRRRAAPRAVARRAPPSCARCSTRSSTRCTCSRAPGYAHGDLSPYNLLVHEGRIVVIDLPQIVDADREPERHRAAAPRLRQHRRLVHAQTGRGGRRGAVRANCSRSCSDAQSSRNMRSLR